MGKAGTYLLQAETLYLNGSTLEEISNVIPVSVTSLSTWSQENNWPEKKKKKNQRPLAIAEKISQVIAELLEKTINGDITTEDADKLAKLASVQQKMGAVEDFPAITIFVMGKFVKYVNSQDWSDEIKEGIANAIQGFFILVSSQNYGEK
jgi:hypothetical protein